MPRFRKEIVSEGVYRLADGRLEPITADRIRHWTTELHRYRRNGNLLPGPWSHVDDKGTPIVMGPNGTLPRADLNAGFWDDFATEVTDKGTTLVAYIDVDDSLADKVGKSVKETSIYVQPSFVDGHGNAYRDVPLHIALVTHAIQPGQKNFEKIESPNLAIAMSQRAFSMASVPPTKDTMSEVGSDPKKPPVNDPATPDAPPVPTTASNPDISAVIQALRTCGIVLPQDTNDTNFLSYLMVALGQKAQGDSSESDNVLNQPPEGAQQKQPAPVAMSSLTPEQFQSISREVFMSHPVAKELVAANQALQGHLNEQAKQARQTRINALIQDGTITQEYATAHLTPLLASFQMSFGENAAPSALDVVLASLEALPKRTVQKQVPSFQNSLLNQAVAMSAAGTEAGVVANPFSNEQYDANKIVESFLTNTGGIIAR